MLQRVVILAIAISTVFVSSAYASTPPTAPVSVTSLAASQVSVLTGLSPLNSTVTINGSTPDWKATLKRALATPNTTVFLASTVDMDLSNEDSIPIAQGVSVIGGAPCQPVSARVAGSPAPAPGPVASAVSIGGSAVATQTCGGRTPAYPGPRLYTTTRPDTLFAIYCVPGDAGGTGNIRLSGFRLQGPTWSEYENGAFARGIEINSCNGVEIANMELSGWDGQAVQVRDALGKQVGPQAVKVHDNFIHHNQHVGGNGYGVDVSQGGWALIEHNVFDFNRHAVTHGYIDTQEGSQHKGGYTANENLVLKGGGYHGNCFFILGTCIGQIFTQQFDVHGDASCPLGSSVFNCGQSGDEYHVTNNAFQYTRARAFNLRGTPLIGAFVDNNIFAHNSVSDAVAIEGDWGTTGLFIGPNNTAQRDTFGKYGVCDFDGSGQDDLFLATGKTWWYMNSAKQNWVYLNSMPDTLYQVAFGDFSDTGRCDVFAVHGNDWVISPGGRGPWQSLGSYSVPFDQLRFGHFTGSSRTEIFRRAPDGSWWLVSPGVFGWTQLAGSSLPLAQLHFGDFNGKGVTDVVANEGGHWSVSWGGRSQWQPLNPSMSDSLDNVVIADLDGKGTDDILRLVGGQWQVSVGGRTTWQPLVQTNSFQSSGGSFVGHFTGSLAAQILEISSPEPFGGGAPGSTDPDSYRRSQIFSRATGQFSPYGKYAY